MAKKRLSKAAKLVQKNLELAEEAINGGDCSSAFDYLEQAAYERGVVDGSRGRVPEDTSQYATRVTNIFLDECRLEIKPTREGTAWTRAESGPRSPFSRRWQRQR